MKAVIIDDEAHARDTIRTIVESQVKNISVIGEAENVLNAIKVIDKTKPDIIFLDINLPDGNSFDILKKISNKNFKVIFITAYQEYAIQAIKFSAFDYLLKPINPSELIQAVNKALLEHSTPNDLETKLNAFFTNINQLSPSPKKIVIKTADRVHVVDIRNIIRCESDNSYCTVFLNNGKKIIVSKNLKSYEEILTPQGFIRVHQSHLVNCNYINYYDKQDGGSLVMTDNTHVPVSIQKRPILTEFLDSL
jgi:two-component system LytT family response regulator